MGLQSLLPIYLLIGGLALLFGLYRRRGSSYARLPYPPGPPGLPLLQNAFDISKDQPWLTYSQWGQKYNSDILHASTFGTHFVILNSLETATDLTEKRSTLYSDRPNFVMAGELINYKKWSLSLMPYGQTWRDCRKLGHNHLRPQAVNSYRPLQLAITRRMLTRMMERPEKFVSHFLFMTSEVTLGIAYGFKLQDEHDPLVQLVESVNEFSPALIPGTYLVDVLPFLKYIPSWVPGAGFQRQAKKWREQMATVYTKPYHLVKDSIAQGLPVSESIISKFMTEKAQSEVSEYDEYILQAVTGILYQAGSDTTGAALQGFVLAMTLYPEAQRRAQAELDNVVGMDRLPSFDDEKSLPYVRALIREVMRWYPVGPMGMPHRLLEDDEYRGYYLPKGSIVVTNIWAMSRDSKVYPGDLEIFDPERFLMPDGNLNENIPDSSFIFGFGRRVCSGRYLAYETLYIAITQLLATMSITKAKGDHPKAEFEGGFILTPKPFKCSIRPRSSAAKQLILDGSLASE